MSGRAELPPDARPLRLVPGYCITPDGRVFRAKDGDAVTPLTLRLARGHARQAIEFDRQRLSRHPLNPQEPESLVFLGVEEIRRHDGTSETREVQMVQWVRVPSKRERESAAPREPGEDRCGVAVGQTWMGGGTMHAAGDTTRLWYQLDYDGAQVVFHGPSLAVHEQHRP
jgi:hypothetical protein